jgi:hypothetical protein
VEPTRFRLEGASLKELNEQILREHGPSARIVSAERIILGGIGGFLAKSHFEAVIEVPPRAASDGAQDGAAVGEIVDDAPPAKRRGRRAATPSAIPLDNPRAGLLALLAEAEGTEARIHGIVEPEISTESDDFARILDGLTLGGGSTVGQRSRAAIEAVPPAGPPVGRRSMLSGAEPAVAPGAAGAAAGNAVPAPALVGADLPPAFVPLRGAGDLIVVVGLEHDALEAATWIAGATSMVRRLTPADRERSGAEHPAGTAGRVDALRARADGVAAECAVVLVVAWSGGAGLESHLQAIAASSPDQIWVAVDAGRKPEDTARWVRAVASVGSVDAVAALGMDTTATPSSVSELGLPVVDIVAAGRPSRRSVRESSRATVHTALS